jgi:hypothetical protein
MSFGRTQRVNLLEVFPKGADVSKYVKFGENELSDLSAQPRIEDKEKDTTDNAGSDRYRQASATPQPRCNRCMGLF